MMNTNEINSLILLLLAIPLLFIIFKNYYKKSKLKGPQLPPGPTPWPLIGNIPHLGKLPHSSVANYAQIYGPIMTFKLGFKNLIVGSSPTIAMEILSKQDLILSGRDTPRAFPHSRQELNHISIGWTEDCNESWKNLRALCKSELFSGKTLESQESLREKKIFDMVDFLKANEGKTVNIGQVAFATIFNMLSNILLSRDLISLQEDIERSAMKNLLRGIVEVVSTPNLSDIYPIFNELDPQGLRNKANSLWQQLWSILGPIVEERRKNIHEANQRDFLDTLIDQKFSDAGFNEILMELFNAGADTSTSTIDWMMAELIKNPEIMKKLREELDIEVIKQGKIKESHIMNLPYLQACIKETLRLHPPIPLLLPHRALEDCKVMNYTIPKNAQVMVNVWAIGRDPILWKNPLEFKPERFVNSPLDFIGKDFIFLPFGAGRRMCPGYPMAARQIPLVIASLVHSFDWSLPNGEGPDMLDMKEEFGITLQKKQPMILIPRARK
ncbi:hypothetical protein Leryth_003235 [Lithospermum erythrorhizon]|nr:hypothetical protein Leryth_003235 [Lithospermum erythrorhizon]